MFFKFFSKDFLTQEHITLIKKHRRKRYNYKKIEYENNFVEIIETETAIRILDKEDEIIKALDSVEIFDPVTDFLQRVQENQQNVEHKLRNYDFESIPKVLKRYMKEVDELFFANWINQVKREVTKEEYEKKEIQLEKIIPDYSEADYEKYVVLGRPIPTPYYKKAHDSAKRSYQTVLGLMRSNVDLFKQFMTLTFAIEENADLYKKKNESRNDDEKELLFKYVNASDFETAKKAFSKVMNTLSKALKRRGMSLDYIAVWELQKNGNYHFHVLSSEIPKDLLYDIPAWLDFNHRKKERNYGSGLSSWVYGKSDVQEINHKDKVTTYVSKYIIKSFYNLDEEGYIEYLNKKKYFVTKGLKKPNKVYISEKEFEKIKEENEKNESNAYQKEYLNVYTGTKINKLIYTTM